MTSRAFAARASRVAIGALALGLVLTTASGTSVKRIFLDELAREADLIFAGTVEKITPRKAREGERIPVWTEIRLGEITAVKGAPGKSHTLTVAGGEAGGVKVRVTGMPTLETARRYLVFVRSKGQPICPFVGWGQGVFRLARDEKSGLELVRTEAGSPLARIKGGRLVPVAPDDEDPTRLTFEAFREDVEARMRRHAAEEREKEKAKEKEKER